MLSLHGGGYLDTNISQDGIYPLHLLIGNTPHPNKTKQFLTIRRTLGHIFGAKEKKTLRGE